MRLPSTGWLPRSDSERPHTGPTFALLFQPSDEQVLVVKASAQSNRDRIAAIALVQPRGRRHQPGRSERRRRPIARDFHFFRRPRSFFRYAPPRRDQQHGRLVGPGAEQVINRFQVTVTIRTSAWGAISEILLQPRQVVFVVAPAQRIIGNVVSKLVQFGIAAYDVFVVITLPDHKGRRMLQFTDAFGGGGFERPDDCAQ